MPKFQSKLHAFKAKAETENEVKEPKLSRSKEDQTGSDHQDQQIREDQFSKNEIDSSAGYDFHSVT